MISPGFAAGFIALLMLGLLVLAFIFRTLHNDPPSIYKLFAVRDMLVRLVIEGKIQRDEPHFAALYDNINIMLGASRDLTGPGGWKLAECAGRCLAHHPEASPTLTQMPREQLPDALRSAADELRPALTDLLANHFGVCIQISARRRELLRMQRSQAKALLNMVTGPTH